MIPSRGLRLSSQAIGTGRRHLQPLRIRQFSSIPVQHQAHGLLSKNRASLPGAAHNALRFSQTNTLIRNGASIRFASTTPIPAATIATNTTPSTTEAASTAATSAPNVSATLPTSLDSTIDLTSESLSSMPEHIGYLHNLGLDYGWGPTSMVQYLLEHIHVYAGTPWWVSIAMTAVAFRLLLLKPYIDAADNAAKMQTIMPITKPLTTKMSAAAAAGDNALVMQIRSEVQMINKRAGLKLWKSAVPLIQVPLGYGMFVLLRAMSNIPVPGLEDGGFLWFYNLSAPDPFFILPLATSAVLHWVLRRGGETGAMNLSPQMTRAMIWGMPAMSFIFTFWFPASVQIYFFVSGALSAIQSALFRQDWFRNFWNMTPLPARVDPNATPSQYRGDMKVAAPLSQSELNSRFQGAGEIKEKKGVFGRMMGEAKETVNGVVDLGREKSQGWAKAREVKEKKIDSAAYEKKRREEIRLEKEQEASRSKRAKRARKMAK